MTKIRKTNDRAGVVTPSEKYDASGRYIGNRPAPQRDSGPAIEDNISTLDATKATEMPPDAFKPRRRRRRA